MSTTNTIDGALRLEANINSFFSGDSDGARNGKIVVTQAFQALADLPSIAGCGAWLCAKNVIAAAGNWELVDADPFQGMGDAVYNDGFSPSGKDLIGFLVYHTGVNNVGATDNGIVTIARGAAEGLAIFSAAGDAMPIGPGGVLFFMDPSGVVVTNVDSTHDRLTISVSAGAPVLQVIAIWGT